MIKMFVDVTILLVIAGVALLAIFTAPWWLTVIAIAAVVLLLDKLLNPAPGTVDGEEDA